MRGRAVIRGMTVAVGLLALGYGGYWFVAANAARAGADHLIQSLRDDGVEVSLGNLAVRGFPSRIDTTATDLRLADPDRGIAWDMPWFQVLALSYRPNLIIAAWPDTQTLRVPGAVLTLHADEMRASAHVGLATDLPLDLATLQSGLITLDADSGWRAGASHLLAAFRRAGETDYDLFAELGELRLPAPVLARVDPGGTRPAVVPEVRIEGRVHLSGPLSRDGQVGLLGLDLTEARFDWGDLGLSVTGSLTADAEGRAEGGLQIELRNWPALLELAMALGILAPDDLPMWDAGLDAAAAGDQSLAATLTFADGQMSLGPLPLGPSPLLPLTGN